MPKDYKSFYLVASHMVKNAHWYFKTDEEQMAGFPPDNMKIENYLFFKIFHSEMDHQSPNVECRTMASWINYPYLRRKW